MGVPALAALGYFLTFSEIPKESKQKSLLRLGLARENEYLSQRLSEIEEKMDGQKERLALLEDRKEKTLGKTFFRRLELPDNQKSELTLKDFYSEPLDYNLEMYMDKMDQYLTRVLEELKNNPSWAEQIPVAAPVSENCMLTRKFGLNWDPFVEKTAFHAGIDFACMDSLNVYATGTGTVSSAGEDPFYGIYVRIDHGRGVQTFYAHLASRTVGAGNQVKAGSKIGEIGESGLSTGIHLHYELSIRGEKKNPLDYFIEEIPSVQFLERIPFADAP